MSNSVSNIESRNQRLREVAAHTHYPYEAFLYALDTFPTHYAPILPTDHIDAAELCWRLRDRAIVEFGAAARERLADWSIRSCDDLGNIVYAMVDSGLMGKTEQDSRAEFDAVFDFNDAFCEGAKPRPRPPRYQWRVSSMLVLMTVAAIACTGYARLGIEGGVGIVFSLLIGFFGMSGLIQGFAIRTVRGFGYFRSPSA